MTRWRDGQTPVLTARADGRLQGITPCPLPFMTPRLQGIFDPAGRLELSLWGAGKLATLALQALPAGDFLYAPNYLQAGKTLFAAATDAPALLLRGMRLTRASAARQSATWDEKLAAAPSWEREGNRRLCRLPWGMVSAREIDGDILIAAGENAAELARAEAISPADIIAQAQRHIAACDRMPEAAPVMRSMVMQGMHAALSSARQDPDGGFAGLAAGIAYSAPSRSYYRDSYWTLQALLKPRPDLVAAQVELLAKGIRPDGEAPSAVIVGGNAQAEAFERFRLSDARESASHRRSREWWSDHFDSPLFFILALGDYVRATGDRAAARRHAPLVSAIHARYRALAQDGGLPQKPRHDRDWADNVFKEGLVAYNLGLWLGALDTTADLAQDTDPALAEEARQMAAQARKAVNDRLWTPQGWYADYITPDGFTEGHLALDSLTLLRYDAALPARRDAVLAAVRQNLESRRNAAQPWGDWGMICAYPPFARRDDLRGKTTFAYRYHNGADWPWLDGLCAREMLRAGIAGWEYPLLRWWEVSLAQGWTGAVEYYSPPFGAGSPLQGWSALPAAVALEFAAEARAVRSGGGVSP